MDILELTKRDKSHLVQLCLPIQKAKDKLQFPVLASEKLDGVFGLVITGREAEDTHIFSRTGEEYLSLNHLKEEFSWLYGAVRNQVFIVELYTECIPQPTISGWCRDTKNQHPDIHAYVHDSMSLDKFIAGTTNDTYEGRIGQLASNFYDIRYYGNYPHIHMIPQRYIPTREMLYEYADIIWEKGGEGVVARTANTPYQAGKRNANMVKLKQGVSFDLKVVNFEEGKGKFSGMVGNLICEDRNGKQIKVGTGMTTKERTHWWQDEGGFNDIFEKIVTIDAMSVSPKGVLREPRFKCIRYDKKEADVIE